MSPHADPFVTWFDALYARHTQSLTFQEVRRSLTALSRVYTQDRTRLAAGGALDGRGKRAAFAAFYAPLHYLLVRHAVQTLGLTTLDAKRTGPLCDLGCGTGVAAAAWAQALPVAPAVQGYDVNTWALTEARWNWQQMQLNGSGRNVRVNAQTVTQAASAQGFVAAYAINELDEGTRAALLPALLRAHQQGAAILIIEPISRTLTPWWPHWEKAFVQALGQSTELRMRLRLPERMALLSRAAGLDHQELTARALALPPAL
jgi:hypothetical protein